MTTRGISPASTNLRNVCNETPMRRAASGGLITNGSDCCAGLDMTLLPDLTHTLMDRR
jgi:hypothetical protein